MNKTVLVTGANGYIGHHVVSTLCDLFPDYKIISVDFKSTLIDKRSVFCPIDILSLASEPELFKQLNCPNYCIHLAWKDGFIHNSDSHLQYLPHHFNFLKNLIDHGCTSVSVMGTMHEVGYWNGEVNADTPCNPFSMYGIAKNALRQALLSYSEEKNVSVKWLRAFYITGDDMVNNSIFSKILKKANEGEKSFPFTTGLNKYDFIDVKALALFIVLASLQEKYEGIINVCTGNPISLKEKVEQFISDHSLDIVPEFGAFPTRKYDSPAIWGNNSIISDIYSQYCNSKGQS